VIEKAQELAKGAPLPAEAVGRIYQKLVEEMRNWEAKLDATAPQFSSQPAATGGSKINVFRLSGTIENLFVHVCIIIIIGTPN
jgi:hypothetical protein